jgi:hypothetical protein
MGIWSGWDENLREYQNNSRIQCRCGFGRGFNITMSLINEKTSAAESVGIME